MKTRRIFLSSLFMGSLLLAIALQLAHATDSAIALYESAGNYEAQKEFQKAKEIYRQIAEQYPSDPLASESQINLSKMDILTAITKGEIQQAQALTDNLIADFSINPYCYKALYGIANRFENTRNYTKAKQLYQQITNLFAACPYFETARISAVRCYVIDLIESGSDAQQAINTMASDFNQNPDLAKSLYHIANRYEYAKKYDNAIETYRLVIEKCPQTKYATDAQVDIRKINILSAIESGNDSAADIDNLCNDFVGNSAVPGALYNIAKKYESCKSHCFDDKSKPVYQKIVQLFPDASYAIKAKLDFAKMEILEAIWSGKDDRNQINKFVNDFADNPYLPAALNTIAERYGEIKKFDKARDVYSTTAQRFGQSRDGQQAAFLGAQANILFLIESGDLNKAQIEVDKFQSDFASNTGLANALFVIGERYQNAPIPDYNNAAILYQKVTNSYPGTKYAESAKVYVAAKTVLILIDSLAAGDPNATIEAISGELATLITSHSATSPELYIVLRHIAEKAYLKGAQIPLEGSPQNIMLLNLSLDIVEKEVIGKTSDKIIESHAYYMVGLDCLKLGDNLKAAQAFASAYQSNPNHEFADFCLYKQGYCYEKLIKQNAISETEAKQIIRTAYSKLILRFPDSRYKNLAAKGGL